MKALYKNRLLKLATHLEKGKLAHKKFDYTYFNSGKQNAEGCGTSGCAIGECPTIFRDWKWVPYGVVYKGLAPCEGAKDFFGLELGEYHWLFNPYENKLGLTTAKQVGKHIRKFIQEKEAIQPL